MSHYPEPPQGGRVPYPSPYQGGIRHHHDDPYYRSTRNHPPTTLTTPGGSHVYSSSNFREHYKSYEPVPTPHGRVGREAVLASESVKRSHRLPPNRAPLHGHHYRERSRDRFYSPYPPRQEVRVPSSREDLYHEPDRSSRQTVRRLKEEEESKKTKDRPGRDRAAPGESRVYFGNLSIELSRESLIYLVEAYGPVTNVSLKRGPNNNTFAFVSYGTQKEALNAIRALDGKSVLGRRVKAELTLDNKRPSNGDLDYPRESPREASVPRTPPNVGGQSVDPLRRPRYKMIIERVPSGATWRDLKDYFRPFGRVAYANVFADYSGVVEFESHAHVEAAIHQCDRKPLDIPGVDPHAVLRLHRSSHYEPTTNPSTPSRQGHVYTPRTTSPHRSTTSRSLAPLTSNVSRGEGHYRRTSMASSRSSRAIYSDRPASTLRSEEDPFRRQQQSQNDYSSPYPAGHSSSSVLPDERKSSRPHASYHTPSYRDPHSPSTLTPYPDHHYHRTHVSGRPQATSYHQWPAQTGSPVGHESRYEQAATAPNASQSPAPHPGWYRSSMPSGDVSHSPSPSHLHATHYYNGRRENTWYDARTLGSANGNGGIRHMELNPAYERDGLGGY